MTSLRFLFQTSFLGFLAMAQIHCGGKPEPGKIEPHDDFHRLGHVKLSEEAMKQAGVETGTVQSELVSDIIRTTGVVGPDENSVTHIRPLTRGRIETVFVGLGDQVRRGAPLAEYDNIELGETAGEYQNQSAELQRENALENVAQKALRRTEELLKIQAVSQREYEFREAELKSAQATIKSRRANLTKLEDKLRRFGMDPEEISGLQESSPGPARGHFSHTTLRSPLDGVIIRRDVYVGEAVDYEKELFTIVDISHVWIQANLAEKDLSKVSLGNSVRIRSTAYPVETVEGKITYISDTLDPEIRVVKVRCLAPNPDRRLKLEMFVDVEIVAPGRRRAVLIPHSALLGDRETYYVFVEDAPGKFLKRFVKIAEQHTEKTEVLEGLRVGERIAMKGAFYIKSESQRSSLGEKD